METIIARQPIFDLKRRLFAYELLYRGADNFSLANIGGDRATGSLLTSSFLTEGLERISDNKPCFVNFTEELLITDVAQNFPNGNIIVEILEDVHPTEQVIAVCKKLKESGYVLALDDFIYREDMLPLVELVDFIKLDFHSLSIEQICRTLEILSSYSVDFVAEKVETYDQFNEAKTLGFSYFQGYFFAKPELMRIKEMTTSKLTLLSLLFEINKKTISAEKLTEIISAEAFLSYKLLRFLNSAYFYLIKEIKSIGHAVAYLGENEIRRFVTLAIISEIASSKPAELVRLAAVRARFCEQLSMASPLETDSNELFMLGLFSLLDAMLDCSMADAVGRIPLSNNVKLALHYQQGRISKFLEIAIAYERGQSQKCFDLLQEISVAKDQLYSIYLSSLRYADIFINL